MALAVGARLGPYEIQAALGAGGMGEVYRGRDTKLNRDVALKILPELFAADPDRLARFQREAQLLASLNHPRIAAIYGLEEADGVRALVLELVEGDTLADRIAQGPIPLEEALPIARQITEALEAAHAQGIIHRDLKPANIKLRLDGAVKVLDFGLAKALEPAPVSGDVSQSPTMTTPAMTQMGVLLGTAAYMSPEQAKGRAADKRSDVWAFGCVLFEMLTGRRTFSGEDVAETLAYILTKEPAWALLPPETPPSIRRLLRRCLEKDRTRRLADMADARLELDDVATEDTAPAAVATHAAPWRHVFPWTVAGLFLLAAALALWSPWRAEKVERPMRLRIDLGVEASLLPLFGSAAILSPDGTRLAFVARGADEKQRMYLRPLDQLEATSFPGTEGAVDPFFSPDGQWIAFFADGKLKKVEAWGGVPLVLCDAPSARGGSWGEDGTIVFAPQVTGGLFRVSSAGGTPQPLTTLNKEKREGTHRWPQVLPGGKAVLFSSPGLRGSYGDTKTLVYSLSTGAHKEVQVGSMYGRYLPAAAGQPIGHLAYVQGGTLFAAPFDLDKLEMTAQPVPVLEEVVFNSGTGGAQFDFSRTGALVFLAGKGMGEDAPLQWLDAQGKSEPLRSVPASYGYPRFSPDGGRLAVTIYDGPNTDVWIYDWARDNMARFTSDSAIDEAPLWTPDGQRIAFRSMRDGPPNIYWQRADGTGAIERLTKSENPQTPGAFSPDGKTLAYAESDPETRSDICLLPMEGDERAGWKPGKPRVFLKTPFAEGSPAFSPDGRWLAYVSDETGTPEVFVRPSAGPSGKSQISSGGGYFPRWSANGRELFYAVSGGHVMVATYRVPGSVFLSDKPRRWSGPQFQFTFLGPRPTFDLHPDGKRVVVLKREEKAKNIHQVTLILNFSEELRRRISGGKK